MKNLILILAVLMVAVSAFGGTPVPMAQAQAEKICQAIYRAEGGAKTKHPYGVLSVRVSGVEEARKVCLTTIKNNYIRWQNAGSKGEFLVFLANVYAPTKNATNDPTGLNNNWLKNVRAIVAAAK